MRVGLSTHVPETTETKGPAQQPRGPAALKNTPLPLLFPCSVSAPLSTCFPKEIIKDTDFFLNKRKMDRSLSKHILKPSSDEMISVSCAFHQTKPINLDNNEGFGLHPHRGQYCRN